MSLRLRRPKVLWWDYDAITENSKSFRLWCKELRQYLCQAYYVEHVGDLEAIEKDYGTRKFIELYCRDSMDWNIKGRGIWDILENLRKVAKKKRKRSQQPHNVANISVKRRERT